MGDVVANFALPQDLAVQVERRGVDGAGVQEVDEQSAAVASDGGRSGRRVGMFSRVRLPRMHLGLPDKLPRAALETQDGLRLLGAI